MKRRSLLFYLKRYLKGFVQPQIQVVQVVKQSTSILEGKTAIVTGATQVVGQAIVEEYINAGCTVIGVSDDEHKLSEMSRRYETKFKPLFCNLSDYIQVSQCLSKATKVNPSIDILVNAATFKNGQDDRFWDYNEQDFDEAISVNVKAPFFLCRSTIDHFLKRKAKGYIVNLIGIKGSIGEGSPYGISKFGLNGMTKGLARRFAKNNIIINGISPGAVADTTKSTVEYLHSDAPNMRMADPTEIANIALFLVSGMADNMIGSIVTCDGGEMLQYLNNRY